MGDRTASRLAWIGLGSVALVHLLGLAFSLLNRAADHPEVPAFDPFVLALLSFPVVGVLVASREPRNAIGWVLLAIGLVWGLLYLLTGYALYGLGTRPGSLPRPDVALLFVSWLWIPAVGLMATYLILLFPDGRLPSPRWRPLAWACAVAVVFNSAATFVRPGSFANEGFPGITNPLGLDALRPVRDTVDVAGLSVLLLCIVGCALGLVRRFRRARGQERLQLKWLAGAASAVALAYTIPMAFGLYLEASGGRVESTPWFDVLWGFATSSFLLIPVAIGIAILRHRLYDIDVIVNRALVYGALTLLLGIAYLVGVVGLGVIVRALTNQDHQDNGLAVAASTLAVAALFRPARARIQGFIDRRFYRRKYDVTKTLEAFGATLRDQVGLDALTADLLGVVNGTMNPVHASLWLRDPSQR